jgi:hypothetical protein
VPTRLGAEHPSAGLDHLADVICRFRILDNNRFISKTGRDECEAEQKGPQGRHSDSTIGRYSGAFFPQKDFNLLHTPIVRFAADIAAKISKQMRVRIESSEKAY